MSETRASASSKPQDTTSTAAPSTGGIIVHHLNNSRSQRLLWLLEELEVPYSIKKYERLPNQLAPPELKEIFPLGKAPVLQDGDVTLAESGAIIEYLINKYGDDKFKPPSSGDGYVTNLYFSHAAEGTVMPYITHGYIFTLTPSRVPFFIRPIANKIFSTLNDLLVKPNVQASVEYINTVLEKSPSPWFAGGPNPTSADFMMLYPMEVLASPRWSSSQNVAGKITGWVENVHSRPQFKRALEKGGPYALASKSS